MSSYKLVQVCIWVCILVSAWNLIEFRTRPDPASTTTSSRTSTVLSSLHSDPRTVFHTYMQQHSHEALLAASQNSNSSRNRLYAVAYYSCPHRGGNMILSFLNAMIWAITSNRTLLWAYDPTASNQVQDCDMVLQRASWIPAYHEWKKKPSSAVVQAVHLNTRRRSSSSSSGNNSGGPGRFGRLEQRSSLQNPEMVWVPQIPDVARNNPQISRVSWWEHPRRMTTRYSFLNVLAGRDGILFPSQRQILRTLYSRGLWYLYGMLFRHSFIIRLPSTILEPPPTTNNQHDDIITIGLHSRHMDANDQGTDITPELHCLSKLLKRQKRRNKALLKCTILVMSDRTDTIAALQQDSSVVVPPCRVATYPHVRDTSANNNNNGKDEHGPFAGRGFWYDLQYTAQARTAIIGDLARSSTVLLASLITYDRNSNTTTAAKTTTPLQTCALPKRYEPMMKKAHNQP